jgi:hypothetical protein
MSLEMEDLRGEEDKTAAVSELPVHVEGGEMYPRMLQWFLSWDRWLAIF